MSEPRGLALDFTPCSILYRALYMVSFGPRFCVGHRENNSIRPKLVAILNLTFFLPLLYQRLSVFSSISIYQAYQLCPLRPPIIAIEVNNPLKGCKCNKWLQCCRPMLVLRHTTRCFRLILQLLVVPRSPSYKKNTTSAKHALYTVGRTSVVKVRFHIYMPGNLKNFPITYC